jgi:hypothetical protein
MDPKFAALFLSHALVTPVSTWIHCSSDEILLCQDKYAGEIDTHKTMELMVNLKTRDVAVVLAWNGKSLVWKHICLFFGDFDNTNASPQVSSKSLSKPPTFVK